MGLKGWSNASAVGADCVGPTAGQTASAMFRYTDAINEMLNTPYSTSEAQSDPVPVDASQAGACRLDIPELIEPVAMPPAAVVRLDLAEQEASDAL